MKVYLNTDVILDYLFAREPFYSDSLEIIAMIEKKKIEGYISSLILWNIYYVLAKYLGETDARNKIKLFRKMIEIIPIDSTIIDKGLNSNIKDFEDSIQYFAAQTENIDFFITGNIKDYPRKGINIITPENFIKMSRTDTKLVP